MSQTGVQLLDRGLIRSLLEGARNSPRLRTNFNFHASADDNPHRFLNVMLRGTYITPHRHRNPPKAEAFVVIEGELAFFTFDNLGRTLARYTLGREAAGIDIAPGIWHTMAVLTPHAVCYEVKPGPYLALTDKEFAPWAPREGDPAAQAYLERLLSQLPDSPGTSL